MSYYSPPDISRLTEHVPAQLRELPVWLLWRELPSREKGGKPGKMPQYANGSARGKGVKLDSAEDRAQLVTLDVALAHYDGGRHAGLGVALGGVPDTSLVLSGIDLDECIRNGDLAPRAQEVVRAGRGAYCEVSPSRRGVKLYGTGDIGTEASAELEIYSGQRFFAVTGERLEGDRLADLTDAASVARQLLLQHQEKSKSGIIRERTRNNTLFRHACRLRARDVTEEKARAELRQLNEENCEEPLNEREVEQILKSAWRYPPGYAQTDLGNARRLVDRYGEDLRYVPESKKMLVWMGTHWAFDRDGEAERRTKDTVRAIFDEARDCKDEERQKKLTAWALTSQSAGRIASALQLARTEKGIPVAPERLDADPMLLGVGNGVVDLRTGKLRPARREDFIVMRTTVPFDPKAEAPQWRMFLEQVAPDVGLRNFLQVAVGYTLTGLTTEQCLFLVQGSGKNGKTTFVKTVQKMLGEYATSVDTSTWMVRGKHHDRPPNDLAALRGKRLVVSPETEEGQRFAEVLLKQVTGGDRIRARFLYAEFFEFDPQFKLWLLVNHKPVIRGDDLAIWRRMRLLPFTVTIAEERADKNLPYKLERELPGILRWAVEGCLAWQREGLVTPECVRKATEEYRSEMDHFGNFLNDCCVVGPQHKVQAKRLFDRYVYWAADQGIEHPWSMKTFGQRIADRGVTKVRKGDGYEYQGVAIGVEPSELEEMEAEAAIAAAARRRRQ